MQMPLCLRCISGSWRYCVHAAGCCACLPLAAKGAAVLYPSSSCGDDSILHAAQPDHGLSFTPEVSDLVVAPR